MSTNVPEKTLRSEMAENLNYTTVAARGHTPTRWLFVLHGIYGSGRNWGSLARRLVEARPDWAVQLLDLRLHGGSPDLSPPHTLDACARDVLALESELGQHPDAILGHSFGGKVALVRDRLDPSVPQVWVADSTLRTGTPTGTAWQVVEIVKELPPTFASRDELADAMVEHGYERGVGQWLAMNLEREGDRFIWSLDWQGVEAMLRDYFAVDVWDVIESPPTGSRIDIIKAVRSEAIDEESAQRIDQAGTSTGRVALHRVEAGHWLNVDNPEAVLDLLATNLTSD